MKPLGPTGEHYFLALGMAKAAGVNLQAAIDEGRFDQGQWADLVQRCRGCGWAKECPSWLQRNHNVESAPDTCANAGVFAAVK